MKDLFKNSSKDKSLVNQDISAAEPQKAGRAQEMAEKKMRAKKPGNPSALINGR